MKRLIGLMLFLLVATLSFATGEEKQYTLQDVPNVRLSDVRQYVSDPSHILSGSARDTINAVLARLEESTGIETAVVMLPSIGEADIFNFAHELFPSGASASRRATTDCSFSSSPTSARCASP